MKARRITCGLLGVLALFLIAAVVILVNRGKGGTGQVSDPSYVLITAPSNGDILFVGDPVYVQASAMLLRRNLGAASLFVDGGKYSLDAESQPYSNQQPINCPSTDTNFCGDVDTRQLWIPTQAGQHNVYICIDGDNTSGAAWNICSDPVNVTVVDPAAQSQPAGVYSAADGDTIASVAQKFGLPPLMVAAANPQIDPSASLPKDTPINIPGNPSLTPLSAGPGSDSSLWTVNEAKMATSQPIDKGYCYYSLGANNWTRIPAEPQTFVYPLNGQLDLTAQLRSLTIPPFGGTLTMDCWGWSGASLVSLGSGKTTFTPSSSPAIHLAGDQFTLDASLGIIPGNYETRGIKYMVPPPSGLTGISKVEDCISHIPSDALILVWFCKAIVEVGNPMLVWEWSAPLFPPDTPGISWLSKIDGYHVYMVLGGKTTLIKTIHDPGQKVIDAGLVKKLVYVTAKPPCFFARAFAGPLESANSNTYCLGSIPSGLATVTISDYDWDYGGRIKTKESGTVHIIPPYYESCMAGLAGIVGSSEIKEVAVGWEHYEPEGSCLKFYWEYSRAHIRFDLGPVKGPVSSAVLTYRQDFTTRPGSSCARKVGIVTTKVPAAIQDLAYDPYTLLSHYGYTGAVFKVDVTSAVRDWMLGTPNYGFLLVGVDEGLFPDDYEGFESDTCWTAYSNFALTVTYFVP